MLRIREYGGPDKGTRVSYEIKRKFTRATDFKSAQYIQSNWKTASDGLIPDTMSLDLEHHIVLELQLNGVITKR